MIHSLRKFGISVVLWFGMGIGLANSATFNSSETDETSRHIIPVSMIVGMSEITETSDSSQTTDVDNSSNISANQTYAMVLFGLGMLGLSARNRRNNF
jgi:PEP-CTERM motif